LPFFGGTIELSRIYDLFGGGYGYDSRLSLKIPTSLTSLWPDYLFLSLALSSFAGLPSSTSSKV